MQEQARVSEKRRGCCCCSTEELAQARPVTTEDSSASLVIFRAFLAPLGYLSLSCKSRTWLPLLVMRLQLRANGRICVMISRKLQYLRHACYCYYFNQFSFPSYQPNAFLSKRFPSVHPTPMQAAQQKLETGHSFT